MRTLLPLTVFLASLPACTNAESPMMGQDASADLSVGQDSDLSMAHDLSIMEMVSPASEMMQAAMDAADVPTDGGADACMDACFAVDAHHD